MKTTCGICLGADPGPAPYHLKCLKELFGATELPVLDLDERRLLEVGMAMVGHTSLSGVQKKISLTLDRTTLRYAIGRSQYILKPPASTFPQLPENEHLTMRLARLFDIRTPPCGLLSLKDGKRAYIVRRFDRLDDGKKLQMEEFCQLAELSPKDKYRSSAEQCVKIVRRYASEPLLDLMELYRVLVFSWWSGNGDMHLKNFALLRGEDGRHRLSPSYDLVATDMYPGIEPGLALPVDGRKSNLRRPVWLRFAATCGIPGKVAGGILDKVGEMLAPARALVSASWLEEDFRERYVKLLEKRARSLA